MGFNDISNKVRRQKFLSFAVVLFTLAFGVLIGTVVNTGAKAAKDQTFAAPGASPLTIPSPVQLQNSFSTLAKMLEPSVVNISSEYIPSSKTAKQPQVSPHSRRQTPNQDEDQNDSMQEFMQRFFGQGGGSGGNLGGMDQEDRRTAGLGSGVVVDRNGYILTNNHVVEHSTRLRVKFTNDSTEYPAKVIGTDTLTDLAVIKIDKTGLIPAKIGNSDAVQVGDWAVAIGSPFGFQATVTAGIVSAKHRSLDGEANAPFQKFIQTDAAINPGNSGGPLLNINGEVIGINTMIASRSGGYQGIGFAMPINSAVAVYNSIIKTGHVTRGSIGISFLDNAETKDLIKAYGGTHGVFVREVSPDMPADKAGIKPEDIITSVDGNTVKNGQDLIDIVSLKPVGSTVNIAILRGNKTENLKVAVVDRAKLTAGAGIDTDSTEPNSVEPTQAKFGISIQNLNDGMKQNTGYKGKGGVVIQSVEPGSFGDDIHLAKGDVIESMTSHNQHEPVNSVDDVKRIQAKLKAGDIVAFKVWRSAGVRGGAWQALYPAGTLPAQ